MSKLRELKNRFVDDFNLPIQVTKSPYFEYFLSLYENHLGTETKWNELYDFINAEYPGDNERRTGRFLEDYYKSRDHIITSIENSDAYKQFNSCNMGNYAITNEDFKKIPKTSIYLEPNDGKMFLSIDMKQANYNTLRYHDRNIVLNTLNYDDFIVEMLGKEHVLVEYFQRSKYTRQIIFGKLNMSRNITIQKYIMQYVFKDIENIICVAGLKLLKPYSYNTDELIYEIIQNEEIPFDEYIHQVLGEVEVLKNGFKKCSNAVINVGNIFNFELFKLGTHKFINSNEGKLVVYVKTEVPYSENSKVKIKSCPTNYYAQVYKLMTNQKIVENDLIFYYEHQLAKFLEPIRFAK